MLKTDQINARKEVYDAAIIMVSQMTLSGEAVGQLPKVIKEIKQLQTNFIKRTTKGEAKLTETI